MNRKLLQIRIIHLSFFTLLCGLMVFLQFLAPWFIDTYMRNLSTGLGVLVGSAVPFLVALILVIAFSKALRLTAPSLRPEIKRINPTFILFGVILVFAAQMVVTPILSEVSTEFLTIYTDDLTLPFQSGLYPMITVIFLFPVLQEWLFRGAIQTTLVRSFGTAWGISLGALFYGLCAVIPHIVITDFASAFVYGAIFFLTRSMTNIIAIHLIANGFTYLVFLMFGSEQVVRDTILEGDSIISLVLWIGSLVLLVVTGFVVRRRDLRLRAQQRAQMIEAAKKD